MRGADLGITVTRGVLPPLLAAALTAGAVVVTPNRRLARRITVLYDTEQRGAGRTAWPAATVLPWAPWQQSLWLDALAAEAMPELPRLITPAQSTHLWGRIVAAELGHTSPLVDPRGVAALAAEAWTLVHAWGSGGPSWRGWAGGPPDDDSVQFARWADAYAAALARPAALDAAQLGDALIRAAPRVPAWHGLVVALAGFLETTPQQERLLAALAATGARITRLDTLTDAPAFASRATAETPREELTMALNWARAQATAAPGTAVGIAIEDLATRRAEVVALAEDLLCPALQWPGQESAPRPYNLSLGQALADVPLVATAMNLIAIAHAPLPAERAAALVRSPYLAGADAGWMGRASVESEWINDGRRELSLADAIGALGKVDRMLAERWRAARDPQRLPSVASPRSWIEAWRAWLTAAGWPGERPLSSAEYQARGAWEELLGQFASLAAVEVRLTRADAMAALRALAATKVFQPEVPAAPIQILGVLEAAGLAFDALWVTGLTAERWPPAPQPNPLLPLRWQRERNVPRSAAPRELAYAQALTAQFLRAAPVVVLSHARIADDHPRAASALIISLPAVAEAAIATRASTTRAAFAARPAREGCIDDRAPSLAPGSRAPGGAGLVEKQSDCPFRAVAAHRLGAEPWPEPIDGLSAMERGALVHQALAAFWRNVRDHTGLVALVPHALDAQIESAVAAAIASDALPAARWRKLPPIVVAGEPQRIARLVRAWLDPFDRERPPFTVRAVETPATLTLSGLTFRLRLDRIDELGDGGLAIIDYKTGRASAPGVWFDPRPQAPQLGLYSLALRMRDPSVAVRAVAYAQLKPGEMKLRGLAADATAWPALPQPSALKEAGFADWTAMETGWDQALRALTDEIAAGHAAVAPRDLAATCRRCGLQSLCRIGALVADPADEGPNE